MRKRIILMLTRLQETMLYMTITYHHHQKSLVSRTIDSRIAFANWNKHTWMKKNEWHSCQVWSKVNFFSHLNDYQKMLTLYHKPVYALFLELKNPTSQERLLNKSPGIWHINSKMCQKVEKQQPIMIIILIFNIRVMLMRKVSMLLDEWIGS